jgi:arylsulfatase A-like enzyme
MLYPVNASRVAAVLAVAALVGCASPQPPPPPNVVLIVVDALRADHLSHYGYHRDTAPGLEAFSSQATRFEDCHAPSSWTNPSVASLFTGLHPARHRAHELGAVLAPELDTLAEILTSAGWHTAGISFNPGIRSELSYDQGFDSFDEHLGASTDYPDISEMLSRVREWLDHRPDQPFFLYLHPMNVHGPYRVPEDQREVLLGRDPGREFRYYGEPMRGILRRGELQLREQVSPSYLESLVDSYDTAIRYSTDQLGILLEMLSDAGVYDESLIIITADHGEELFDHGGFSHGYTLHREVLHVPLYLKLPHQSEGRVAQEAVGLMDLLPTIVDLAGIDVEAVTDGRSLLPLITAGSGGEPFAVEPRVYQTARRQRCVARAIADERFKLIEIDRNYEGLRDAVLLYDQINDPGEFTDFSSERSEVVVRLRRRLRRQLGELARLAVAEPDIRLEDLDQERLRALGYLE